MQDPAPAPAVAPVQPVPVESVGHATTPDVVTALQNLGWIDLTALGVLFVFFVIGLFKGFVWQVSRAAILVVAWIVAMRFGDALGEQLLAATHDGPEPASPDQRETLFYVACVLLFVGVLVVLSLLAQLLQRLVQKAGLTFFDRLGGGVVGVATGACVVVLVLTGMLMFFPRSEVAAAADGSWSLRWSRRVVSGLGGVVPPELQQVFAEPAATPGDPLAEPPGPVQPSGAHVAPPGQPGQPSQPGSGAGQPIAPPTRGR